MMKSRTLIACFKPETVHINSVRPVQLTVQRYMCWINKQNTNVQRIPVLQISSNGESKLQNISIEEILEKGNRKFHLRDKNIFNIYAQYAWNLQKFFFNQSSILHNILIFYNRDLRLLSKGKNTFFQNIFNSRFSDCVVSVSQNYTDLMNIYRLIILVESSKLCAILPRPQAACYILEIESIRKNYLK